MRARVAIIDFPASVPAALERSHYFFDADSEKVTHFPVCLKVLADLLTDWTIIDLVTDAQLQMWFEVSQLTSQQTSASLCSLLVTCHAYCLHVNASCIALLPKCISICEA